MEVLWSRVCNNNRMTNTRGCFFETSVVLNKTTTPPVVCGTMADGGGKDEGLPLIIPKPSCSGLGKLRLI